jgi:membrane protease YdiL (CAAX protease family)
MLGKLWPGLLDILATHTGMSITQRKVMKTGKKHLWLFFMIAFAWMWGLNAPRLLASLGIISLKPLLSTLLGYAAFWGPAVAAFSLTAAHSGREGLRELWRRGWKVQFSPRWWLPALLLMPLMGGLTLLILRAFDLPIAWEHGLFPAMIVPIGLVIWLVGALPEEYGWRGYALGRLLEEHSPRNASLLLGLIWAAWHLPLHFISTSTQAAIPIWEFWLQTVVLTVIYTWLYLSTGGSVLIAGLFHATGNLTGAVIPYWTTEAGRWISFGLLLIPAMIIILQGFQTAKSSPLNE